MAKAEGRIRPARGVFDCQLISVMHTSREPMRGFVDKLMAMEGKNGVLSISIAHGFPWGDTADMGAKVLVYTDGDAGRAEALARELGQEIIGFREQLSPAYPPPTRHWTRPWRTAPSRWCWPIRRTTPAAARQRRHLHPGTRAGARHRRRGDGSVLGSGLGAALFRGGRGRRGAAARGRQVAPVSGQPLDLRCTVLALKREAVMTGLSNTPALLGDVAILRTGGVVLALTSLRTQAMGTDMFTQFGIDLAAMKLIVVKSSQHFYASYSQVAKHVIYVATPGAITQDYNSLPYRKVQRPKWPLTA